MNFVCVVNNVVLGSNSFVDDCEFIEIEVNIVENLGDVEDRVFFGGVMIFDVVSGVVGEMGDGFVVVDKVGGVVFDRGSINGVIVFER